MKPRRVAVLMLGETLLVPHLYPVVEALAADDDLTVDVWVSTGALEALIAPWLAALDRPDVRLRRAPGFRHGSALPPKLRLLARLAPRLLRCDAVLCAEQTSLWLPRLFPFLPPFVKTAHGVGSMSARDDRRRRAAWRMLVPGEAEHARYLAIGFPAEQIAVTGYVKASFRQRSLTRPPFPDDRPIVLYTPHWQRHRSSWWAWGAQIVEQLAADPRWNVIIAPHQRLVERAPEVRAVLAAVAGLPHMHCDLDSFAMIDGSYTTAADIYLGDTSSQVIEFLTQPRPCVFLNPARADWAGDPDYAQWHCGEVVDTLDAVLPALAAAPAEHPRYAARQVELAQASLGDCDGAPARVAAVVRAAAFR